MFKRVLMKLFKLKIQKSKLFSIPDHELLFLIQAMMLYNELNTLRRCVTFSNPRIKRKNEIIATALFSQVLFFYRTLAGKLYEGWHLIRKIFTARSYQ